MNEETAVPTGTDTSQDAGRQRSQAVVSFCQQCGRSLTADSQRRLGAGIFCEPCAAIRTAQNAGPYATPGSSQAGGWQPVNAGAGSSYPPVASALPRAGEPNPVLAGFLGLIPGVGAMFNGQYPKGVLHLIVFVVLVSLADNLNWVFWWFVWGWIFYQAFDAYHTALARRDGQPLPDPFGWNELGERFGMGRTSPAPTPPYRPAQRDFTDAAVPPPPPPAESYTGFATASTATSATTATMGEAFATVGSTTEPPFTSYPPISYAPETAGSGAPYQAPYTAPYVTTFTGSAAASSPAPDALQASRRFPVGAAWLIGLGTLFLLGNLLPSWRLDGRWFVPVLLAGIAVWTGSQRLSLFRGAGASRLPSGSAASPLNFTAGVLLGPSLLLTVAILLGLQNFSVVPLRHSWPALLIIWGGLLLLDRARIPGGASGPPSAAGSVVPSASDAPLR